MNIVKQMDVVEASRPSDAQVTTSIVREIRISKKQLASECPPCPLQHAAADMLEAQPPCMHICSGRIS